MGYLPKKAAKQAKRTKLIAVNEDERSRKSEKTVGEGFARGYRLTA